MGGTAGRYLFPQGGTKRQGRTSGWLPSRLRDELNEEATVELLLFRRAGALNQDRMVAALLFRPEARR